MHMWHHVTNHLIISNDKDSNSENRIKLRVRDSGSHMTDTCSFTIRPPHLIYMTPPSTRCYLVLGVLYCTCVSLLYLCQ
jgi:hypothetical protein